MQRQLQLVGLFGPGVGLIAFFILVPIALTVWLSFHDWSTQTGFDTARFIGLQNFFDIFGPTSVGRDFKRALVNTAAYSALSIAIILPLGVVLGLLVYQTRVWGGEVLRTVLFSTYMVPSIATALVWAKLYSPTEGPFNQMLSWIGIGPQPWLSSPDTALVSLVYLNVWQQAGYFTVLVVAGLTQIPQPLNEAARIDGASPWQIFWRITLPLLRRPLLFCAVICLINAVQVFEPVVMITQGGPVGSTNVLTYHIRRVGIERADGGLGSAMAVMLLLTLIITVVALFAMARRVDEPMSDATLAEEIGRAKFGSTNWPRPSDSALILVMIVVAVAAAFPLAWMVLSSLKTPAETMHTPPVWFPQAPSLAAYAKVSGVIDAGRSFLNSAIIATVTTAGIIVTSLMAAYAFAKHTFRGRDLLFGLMLATMFLPPIVTLIPLYRIVTHLGLSASLAGVILPNLASAFGIFLLRQFILGVPDELIEAARLDGASELRIVFQIVAPTVMPAIAALALFAFVYHWNSYLWPLTILQGNNEAYPIVLSLSRLLSYNRGAQNTNLVMAGATLAVLPPLVLFAFLQRFFVNSIISAGVKG